VATFVPLLIMAFWIGLYPKPFFQILEQPVNHTISMARPDYPLATGAVNAAIPATTDGTTYYSPNGGSSIPGEAGAATASDAVSNAPAAAPKMKGNK
jgi:hypothetical protein